MLVKVSDKVAKLYGRIWEGDASYIINEIQSLLDGDEATIHLHTPGGSVIDGNLIYNAIANSKANITTVNDGLCASMGSVILLAGNKIKMASNGLYMAHAPQGTARGTAKSLRTTADVLEKLEDTILEAYSRRTQKSKEYLSSWMDGDNWFSAKQALKEGLIDEIITPIIKKIEGIQKDGSVDMKIAATAFDTFEKSGDYESLEINTKTENMKLEAKSFVALGLKDDATDAEVNAAIADRLGEIDAVKAENQRLKDELVAQQEARVKTLLDNAILEGRIVASEREQFEKLAKTDFALAQSTLAKLTPKKDLNGLANRSNPPKGGVIEGREKWTFSDWSKNDTAGLLALKKENPEAYRALLSNTK